MIEFGIHNLDCIVGHKSIDDKSIDLIYTDLPFGQTYNHWDEIIDFTELWKDYKRILKPRGIIILHAQGMFSAKLMLSNEKWWRYNLIWKKGERVTGHLNSKKQPLRNHEDILIFYGKGSGTYNPQMVLGEASHSKGSGKGKNTNNNYGKFDIIPGSPENGDLKYPKSILIYDRPHPPIHPTQKPLELAEWIIKTYSNEGDVVLDSTSGSGTIPLACKKLNRDIIAFETDNEYYNLAINRFNSEKINDSNEYSNKKSPEQQNISGEKNLTTKTLHRRVKISGLKIKNSESEIKTLNNNISIQNDIIKDSEENMILLLELDFKDNSKFKIYKDKIQDAKDEIKKLNEILEYGYYGEYESSGIEQTDLWTTGSLLQYNSTGSGSSIWNTTYNHINVPTYNNDDLVVDYVTVIYLDEKFNEITIHAYDDVFQSELGNYYLKNTNGYLLYLKKVIYIESITNIGKESKLHKWYDRNIKNYIRLKKIENILDE